MPNLQVIKLMQSFKSTELVTERFSWRHYYWCAAQQMHSAAQQVHSAASCMHGAASCIVQHTSAVWQLAARQPCQLGLHLVPQVPDQQGH